MGIEVPNIVLIVNIASAPIMLFGNKIIQVIINIIAIIILALLYFQLRKMRKYTCPCCDYKTLAEGTRDSYEICKVCFWEDDFVQNEDPDFEGGANEVSLRQAQKNFKIYGASDERFKDRVVEPSLEYEKDENFKSL